MKNVFLTACVLVILSCCSKREEHPKNIYSQQQIAAFLMDLYILEAKIDYISVSKDSLKKVFEHYEKQLFEQHQLNDSLYEVSFNYYLNDPEGLTEIYTILVDSLSLKERLIHSNPAEEK